MPSSPSSRLPAEPTAWRLGLVICLLAGCGLVLGLRLIQLQGLRRSEFARKVTRQRTYREVVPSRPGDLLDRRGRLFATTVATRSLFVVPNKIGDGWDLSRRLSGALRIDADQLFEKLASHPTKQFLWVKRRLTEEEADRVRGLQLPPEIWGFRDEYLRSYPQGTMAAQVLGLRDIDGAGQGGLEQSLESVLRGADGWRELVRDAQGHVIDIEEDAVSPPRNGEAVVLTLDAVIQLYTERALDRVVAEWKPASCCAVVLNPQTGEVLAMASRPTFDPNHPEQVPAAAWKNRVIADIYEPGSTFKPCVVAGALEQGCIQPTDVFDCEQGEYHMGGRVLRDHHPYGRLSVVDILVKSSNIGMAKIGERMTNRGLYEVTRNFGFGRRTGIELPGELTGIVRPLKEWNSYSTGSIPMGQEVAATPLQVIAAYGALTNGGRLISPHLVQRIGTHSEAPRPVVASKAVRGDIADWTTRQALTEVVVRGTGRKAQLKGYSVFGKSGTAQKPDPVTGKYSNRLHVSSFICGAPADKPEVLVLVTVDEPSVGADHYGGTIAAPAAAEILEKALAQLRIPPKDGTIRAALRQH